jgi:hypothetical protein
MRWTRLIVRYSPGSGVGQGDKQRVGGCASAACRTGAPGVGALDHPPAANLDWGWDPAGCDLSDHSALDQAFSAGPVNLSKGYLASSVTMEEDAAFLHPSGF